MSAARARHPSLPGELAGADEPVVDRAEGWPVHGSEQVYRHPFLALDLDSVAAPDGEVFERIYVRHHGGVGVVALDDDDRVLLLEQYRHPVRRRLVQLPAGVLDRAGEDPQRTAERELAEEADLVARRWSPLLHLYPTPGSSDETWRVYLARDLAPAPASERIERMHEEADMRLVWMPLESAVRQVTAGGIGDAMAVSGLLAAWANASP